MILSQMRIMVVRGSSEETQGKHLTLHLTLGRHSASDEEGVGLWAVVWAVCKRPSERGSSPVFCPCQVLCSSHEAVLVKTLFQNGNLLVPWSEHSTLQHSALPSLVPQPALPVLVLAKTPSDNRCCIAVLCSYSESQCHGLMIIWSLGPLGCVPTQTQSELRKRKRFNLMFIVYCLSPFEYS